MPFLNFTILQLKDFKIFHIFKKSIFGEGP